MTDRPTLTFTELAIRRTAGFPTGFTLPGLSPGVNILYGPNASGKSTTARAIHALLWPQAMTDPRASYAGAFLVADESWRIDIDAGALRSERDGHGATPALAPAEGRDRYILTLHDLLAADNAQFAETILRESTGGYNLDAAVGRLGYRAKASRPEREMRDLRAAREGVRAAKGRQEGLRTEEIALTELISQHRAAEAAGDRAIVLREALSYTRATEEHAEAQRALREYPPTFARITGREVEDLRTNKTQLAAAVERRRTLEQTITVAQQQRAATKLTTVVLQPGQLAALRARCQQLQGMVAQIESMAQRVAGTRATLNAAQKRLAAAVSDEQIAALDCEGLRRYADFARRATYLHAERQAAEALRAWLGQSTSSDDPDRLREEIRLLNRWFQIPAVGGDVPAPPPPAKWSFVLAAVALVVATIAGFLFPPLTLLLGAGPLIWIGRRAGKHRPAPRPTIDTSAEASALAAEYARFGLATPSSWTATLVEERLQTLQIALRDALLATEKLARWQASVPRLEALERQEEALRQDRARLQHERGVAPVDEAAQLDLLADQLSRWREAEAQLRAIEAEHATAEHAYRELGATMSKALAAVGYPAIGDHMAALGAIEELDARQRRFATAEQEDRTARATLDTALDPEIARLRRQQAEIFAAIGLDDGNERALLEALEQQAGYRQASERVQRTAFAVERGAAALTGHDALLTCGRHELEAILRREEESAAEREPLRTRIIEIQARVREAREATTLEAAIGAESHCIDDLRDARERDYRLAAGWTLGEFIRRRTRDGDRPRVFHRARELFLRITQGRYRLEFADGTPPQFRATDTTSGLGHDLDQLSSATRLQLLMAVRVAFVEEIEQGPRLPLILDETLGNSDEQRARAIIEAVIAICNEGRQVFYFTAQHDEVGKWLAILAEHGDVPHIALNLAEVRGLADVERLPSVHSVPPALPTVPAPGEYNHHAYGRLLGVPAIDPWCTDVGSIHLWHVIADTGALHRMLSLGIGTWGQLHNLVEHGGLALTGTDTLAYERAAAQANVLRTLLDLRRIGRGRRVDRLAILDSGTVNPTFVDAVVACAEDVGGDAGRLIDALEQGHVKRFRRDAIQALRAYLVANEYLDTEAPLAREVIRIRALGAASVDVQRGSLAVNDIDALLGHIAEPGGAASREAVRQDPRVSDAA